MTHFETLNADDARELLRQEANETVGTDDLEKANKRYDQLLEWIEEFSSNKSAGGPQ